MKNNNTDHEEKRSRGIFLGGVGLLLIGISAVLYSVSFSLHAYVAARHWTNASWVRTYEEETTFEDNENYDQDADMIKKIENFAEVLIPMRKWLLIGFAASVAGGFVLGFGLMLLFKNPIFLFP